MFWDLLADLRHLRYRLSSRFLYHAGDLVHVRDLDLIPPDILCQVHELPLSLHPENVVSQGVRLHGLEGQDIAKLKGILAYVSREIVSHIAQGNFRKKGQGSNFFDGAYIFLGTFLFSKSDVQRLHGLWWSYWEIFEVVLRPSQIFEHIIFII